MKKENRVKSNEEFSFLIKVGKRIRKPEFHIYYLKNNHNHNRFGISVSTKLGNAVVRNKIKRQLRAIMDDFDKSSATQTLDIIVVAKQEYLNHTFKENKDSLLNTLNSIEQ